MTLQDVMKELENFGSDQTKKVLVKHGAQEPFYGVKVQDLKKILKKTKKNHQLALDLYATGNSDAMYLAGLMADEKQITETQLDAWVEKAYWYYLSEYAVAWVTAETPFGFELGLKWTKSVKENIASAGWATLAFFASVKPDDQLDLVKYTQLLDVVQAEIHSSPNRVRYTMNGFVIAVGSYIEPLTNKAKEIAQAIGKVNVDVGGTSCKVPLANDYIDKVKAKGKLGKKRKTARC